MAQENSDRTLLYQLLSIEYNCSPSDFLRQENILTVSALREGRRQYSKTKYFFNMVTLGSNAVVTADERLHPFLSEHIKGRPGHFLFERRGFLSGVGYRTLPSKPCGMGRIRPFCRKMLPHGRRRAPKAFIRYRRGNAALHGRGRRLFGDGR